MADLRPDPHPLEFIRDFLKLRRKQLAGELSINVSQLADCLRSNGGSSLRNYNAANRRLIEVFGVKPETTWPKVGVPLSLVNRPFSPNWFYAWKSVKNTIGDEEPVAFSLARRALIAQEKIDWLAHYRTGFNASFAEAFLELQEENPENPHLSDDSFRRLLHDQRQKDPLFKLKFSEIFENCFKKEINPTTRELARAVVRFNMRSLEIFFPDSLRKIEMPEEHT